MSDRDEAYVRGYEEGQKDMKGKVLGIFKNWGHKNIYISAEELAERLEREL